MKILVISDTHGQHQNLELEKADMIIHCGDFSHNENSFFNFIEWYSKLDYKYKILVSGNHDHKSAQLGKEKVQKVCNNFGDIIYLEDSSVVIEGIKFYGSPYTVEFCNWEFMEDDFELTPIWDKIDDDTQVLITHGPEKGILDRAPRLGGVGFEHTGSSTLSERLRHLKKVKFHLFGHIHGETGMIKDEYRDYTSINAACLWEYNDKRKNLKNGFIFEVF